MSDYVTEWIAVELPRYTHSTDEVLARYGLPETFEHAFGLLVRLLVDAGRKAPAEDPERRLLRELGWVFQDFGAGDLGLGFKYMQAAHEAARDLYCF